MLVVSVGLAWLLGRRPAPPPPLAHQAGRRAPAPHLARRTNAGPAPLRWSLPDGSVVTLEPGSTLAYAAPFGPAGRDLILRGTALFAVTKDAAHPFAVMAGGFTTTVLSTRLQMQATEAQRVTVRLLEGQVVVQATPASPFAMRAQYLTPDRELTVNTRTREVRVQAFDPSPDAGRPLVEGASTPAVGKARPASPGKIAGSPADSVLRPGAAPTTWVGTWCHETYPARGGRLSSSPISAGATPARPTPGISSTSRCLFNPFFFYQPPIFNPHAAATQFSPRRRPSRACSLRHCHRQPRPGAGRDAQQGQG